VRGAFRASHRLPATRRTDSRGPLSGTKLARRHVRPRVSTYLLFSSQKGVDFWGEQSVTGAVPREAVGLVRDPAPLAMESLRGFGGDGAECRYP
jgi:hypothetical protein